jgi:hypothetical protein
MRNCSFSPASSRSFASERFAARSISAIRPPM